GKAISLSEVLKVKFGLQRVVAGRFGKPTDKPAANVIQLDRSPNTGAIANTINIRTSRRSVKLQPPVGTVAADRDKRNYAKYLIDRYHDFKKAEHGLEALNYSMIYQAVKREFKCKWDFIPEERFSDLARYLQSRIDRTILGKNQRARGRRNYR